MGGFTKSRLLNISKHTGIIGVLTLWTGIIVGMSRAGLGLVDTRPISYLGTDPRSAQLFSFSLICSSILFLAFGLYLAVTLKVDQKFVAYLTIGQIGQITAAVIPYSGNYKLMHTIAAFTLAFSLPFLIRQFARSQTNSPQTKTYNRLSHLQLVSFAVGMGIFVLTRGLASIGEALPAIAFHIWIITVTFIHRPS